MYIYLIIIYVIRVYVHDALLIYCNIIFFHIMNLFWTCEIAVKSNYKKIKDDILKKQISQVVNDKYTQIEEDIVQQIVNKGVENIMDKFFKSDGSKNKSRTREEIMQLMKKRRKYNNNITNY